MLLPGAVTSPTPAEDEVGLLTVLGAGLLGALLMLITIGQYMSAQVPKTSVNLDGDVREKFMCPPSLLTQGSRE